MKRVCLIGGSVLCIGVGLAVALYWASNRVQAPADGAGLIELADPVAPGTLPAGPQRVVLTDLSVIDAYTFDPKKNETGKISYSLTEPARIRVIATARWDIEQVFRVITWEWQDAGSHTVLWDGKDQQGHLLNPQDCSVWIRADPKSAFQPGRFKPQHLAIAQLVEGRQGSHVHNDHAIGNCGTLVVRFKGIGVVRPGPVAKGRDAGGFRLASATLLQPAASHTHEDAGHTEGEGGHSHKGSAEARGYRLVAAEPGELIGSPEIVYPTDGMVVKGEVAVMVEVPEGSRGYGDETGYGSRWTIDDQLVGQALFEPDSNGLLWYKIDTTAFPNGLHRLNVSVCDHYDHIGSASVDLVISN